MFFSVIIPVYNVKNYLKQCVDSVLIQDFSDYELILVDDGSTDESGKICDEYKKKDQRIQVVHKANGGQSDARNVGLELANGSYIWFIDSDDYLLNKTAFSIVVDTIKNENADVVFFSYKKFYENSGKYSKSMYAHVSEHADLRECIQANAYKALACNKVVKNSLIAEHHMHFPVGFIGEDLVWCADLLAIATKIILCKDDLMAYRQRDGSITGNKNTSFRIRHKKNVLFLMDEVVKKYEIGKLKSSSNALIGHYLAYEFSWLLGGVYPYWNQFSDEIRRLSFLLEYDFCNKVKKVRLLERFCGLHFTAFILNLYIRLKKAGGH